MPLVCTICKHPDRRKIESQLTQGVALRNIAKQWSVSFSAVHRHKRDCASKSIIKAAERRELSLGESMLKENDEIKAVLKETIVNLKAEKDHRGIPGVCREWRECNRFESELAMAQKEQSQKSTPLAAIVSAARKRMLDAQREELVENSVESPALPPADLPA
jgi:hypothetical protein